MKTFLRCLCMLAFICVGELRAAGSLKVTLAPSQAVSAGAQWRVDGGGWQNSGASKSVSAGSHTVDFKTVSGWLTPAATTVTITNGTTTSLTATYVQPASLKITLTPTSGQWRIDGGTWLASGATATGLTPGNHTVDYAAVSGYASPSAETVTLVSNQTTALARSYTQLAQLSITLSPNTAQWRIDGSAWLASGVTVANLAPGTHTVDYIALAGYTAPASESVTLASGQSLALTRSYIQLAQLTVTLSPATAQWSVDGGAWQASGVTVANLSPGTHTVTYAALSGYIAPAGESVTLASGQLLSLTRAYVQLASITVTLNPSWVMWRVDGGTIVNSGVTVGNLAPGSHTIDYFGQSGWAMPPSETVTLTAGQALALTRAATQLAALTVNYTLNAGYWRMDGGTWNGPTNGAMDIFPGTHAIDYQPRAGWIAPPSETITAVGGQSIVLNPAFVQLGNLNVTLVPASAQWNVDGNAWQPSGNSWSNLTPGTHTVNYSAVSGYLTPAPESVTITSGQTLSISRTYVAAAQVTLTLTPATAQWRLDGGAWQTTGATIGSLAAGDHSIDYQSLNGYTAPASETVTLTAGQSLSLTRSYIQLAQLSITLTPTSGQWRVDGGIWQASGATVANLTPGDHAIDYSTLQNYSSPSAETVTLAAGQSQTLTRAYVQYAQILIGLVPSSGQWRANGGAWQASGTSLFVPPGDYTIDYSSLALYDSPPAETITLAAGGVFATTRNYVSQKPTLRINLTPSTGQWRVDGGAWQNNGVQVIDLAVGSHTVDYTDIGGNYAPLASETISLALRENATLTRTYALKPASITVMLSPTSAQWRVDSGVWQASGATVANLAPGNHNVDYAALSGYTTPASETVALTAGQSLALSRSYPQLAQLTVSLTPTNAQWRLDGGAWQASGATLIDLATGAHTIDYQAAAGYITPGSETVTLAGGPTALTRAYTALAQLTVTLTPSNAQWRVDSGAWQASGATVSNLSLGAHTVDYSTISGYITPLSESLSLVSGPNPIARAYTQPATLTVVLDPSNGQWNVSGGSWRASGTSASLTPGTYSINCSQLAGYLIPPTTSVTLASGEQRTITITYPPRPATLQVWLNNTDGRWRVDGGDWRPSGDTFSTTTFGTHTIDYLTVANFYPRSSETITMNRGTSQIISRAYSPHTGTLIIHGLPAYTNDFPPYAVDISGPYFGGWHHCEDAISAEVGTRSIYFPSGYGGWQGQTFTVNITENAVTEITIQFRYEHHLRFYLNPNLVGAMPIEEVRRRAGQYAAHIGQIFGRETLRALVFDPNNDVVISTDDPMAGYDPGPYPSVAQKAFDLLVYAELTDNPALGSYGGASGFYSTGYGGVHQLKWDQLYDPAALADGSAALEQYWRQIHATVRAIEQVFGAGGFGGASGYDSLAGLKDSSTVSPALADIGAPDSATLDSFWATRPYLLADPLTANAFANPQLGSPTSLAALLSSVAFAPATKAVLNGAYRGDVAQQYSLPYLAPVTVHVIDAQTGQPLPGAILRAWNRSRPDAPYDTYEETVTADGTGTFTFNWTAATSPLSAAENAKLVKADATGYISIAQWTTIYDAQKAKLIDGQNSFEITIALTPQ